MPPKRKNKRRRVQTTLQFVSIKDGKHQTKPKTTQIHSTIKNKKQIRAAQKQHKKVEQLLKKKLKDPKLRTLKQRTISNSSTHTIVNEDGKTDTIETIEIDLSGNSSEEELQVSTLTEAQRAQQEIQRLENHRKNLPKFSIKQINEYANKLKEFDLDIKFGPCVGISRIKRWKRAQTLGLQPPILILKILELNYDNGLLGNNSIFQNRV